MLMGLMQEGGGDPAPLEEDPASGSLLSCSSRSWAKTVWGISAPTDAAAEIAEVAAAAAAVWWRDSEAEEDFPLTSVLFSTSKDMGA